MPSGAEASPAEDELDGHEEHDHTEDALHGIRWKCECSLAAEVTARNECDRYNDHDLPIDHALLPIIPDGQKDHREHEHGQTGSLRLVLIVTEQPDHRGHHDDAPSHSYEPAEDAREQAYDDEYANGL